MDAPKRIQRKRTKGWRMPANTIYVGRPTVWGNPWAVGPHMTPAEAVALYRSWIEAGDGRLLRSGAMVPPMLPALRGKNLACWCPLDQPCHADVLLELATGRRDGQEWNQYPVKRETL